MLPQKTIRLSSNFASLRVARGLVFCSAFSFTPGMQFFSRNVMTNKRRLPGQKDGVQDVLLFRFEKRRLLFHIPAVVQEGIN